MSVGRLCKLFGKSRQAYYQREAFYNEQYQVDQIAMELVAQVRRDLPGLGTKKLYRILREPFKTHGIKIGRDKLHELLTKQGMLIRRRKGAPKTTNSRHWMKKYPNLVRELVVVQSEQLWVADITYLCVGYDFNYLSLITDAYSKKIVGYHLHPNLSAEGSLLALYMALKTRTKCLPLIHHSDRGSQYCSFEYVLELRESDIAISMTEDGEGYENQIAERMNGILKTEFNLSRIFPSHDEAKLAVIRSIEAYNTKRPHLSLDFLTPVEAHVVKGGLQKRWKNYRLTERSQNADNKFSNENKI
ncbi:MAG: IS3 family transposase [Flavisolibacter sp.]